MEFGVCGADITLAHTARRLGYDYFEWGVSDFLHPQETEDAFLAALAQTKETRLPFPVVNRFLPPNLKIIGPEVEPSRIQNYVSTALRRAEIAGISTIVLGAGAARRIPDGFDRLQAREQMINFCRWAGPIAANHGVTIAIEPLNISETNLINSAEEGASLVLSVAHPNIRMLVDGYHWAKDQNTASGILDHADLIVHAHVAAVDGRRAPSSKDTCSSFFSLLQAAGYQGMLSFEGNLLDPENELREALSIMRSQFNKGNQ